MSKRFVSIWFRHLATDWFVLRQPALKNEPFVLSAPSHGRLVVTASNAWAEAQGVFKGAVVADARAIIPGLKVLDEVAGLAEKLLARIAEWCIRFTPFAAVDPPNGIMLDVTGCPHLWGGDEPYLAEITRRLKERGYNVRAAIADTIGAAWAVARFGKQGLVGQGQQAEVLLPLPAAALRLEPEVLERLQKLGLRRVKDFIAMPKSAIRRRFGNGMLQRLNQALGVEEEFIQPQFPVEPFSERLPCLDPIVTATGIEIALDRLLTALCNRLKQEEKGLRLACFKCYRVDGKLEQVNISTSRASCNVQHLLKLFELKIQTIEPGLGIELFVLDAPKVEDYTSKQEKLWDTKDGLGDVRVAELIDRITGRMGEGVIARYLPAEHYWPERSIKKTASLQEQPAGEWRLDRPRPIHLLPQPEHIDVTAPVPDYPPMNFRYKGKLHRILKADGPERIEPEWWIQDGQHRDYYIVEDENGCRYWLFRLGHYDDDYEWFIHGFFA